MRRRSVECGANPPRLALTREPPLQGGDFRGEDRPNAEIPSSEGCVPERSKKERVCA